MTLHWVSFLKEAKTTTIITTLSVCCNNFRVTIFRLQTLNKHEFTSTKSCYPAYYFTGRDIISRIHYNYP